ncbi:hypothetical protein H4S02_005984, partial [Coemansia sp. RSA 2611]
PAVSATFQATFLATRPALAGPQTASVRRATWQRWAPATPCAAWMRATAAWPAPAQAATTRARIRPACSGPATAAPAAVVVAAGCSFWYQALPN